MAEVLRGFAPMEGGGSTAAPPATGLEVRTATAADVRGCAEIAAHVSDQGSDIWQDILQRDVDATDRHLVVAARQDAVVGYGRALWFQAPEGAPGNAAPDGHYLLGLVVHPAHRRLGLGRALTARRLGWIAARADVAWYFADVRNLVSLTLHRSMGFVEVTRDFWFPASTSQVGAHVLCRLDLSSWQDRNMEGS